MSFENLTMRSPGSDGYMLGTPIEVLDGDASVGIVRTVVLASTGDEILLGDFEATHQADFLAKRIAKLVIAEVVHFVATTYEAISAIEITLGRDIDGFEGRQAYPAQARADLLQSIGVRNVRVAPKPLRGKEAHFAVSGMWAYDRPSLEALEAVLHAERAAYAQVKAAQIAASPAPRRRSVLSRVFASND
ncbi:hypothetical protein ACQ858_01730 [Variovorax ureilyticus]|uniref:hypothetical protein n=1 Tax=Variovorax ureilyticus TaxID=1836198 RepID=UPI003D666729